MLDKFKVYNLVTGLPTVSITTNGITFSKNCVTKMGKPRYVILLVNEEDKVIAFKVGNENDDGAIPFVKNLENIFVRINNKDLLLYLSRMMNWDYENLAYRAIGSWSEEDGVLYVDLRKVTRINEKDNDEE